MKELILNTIMKLAEVIVNKFFFFFFCVCFFFLFPCSKGQAVRAYLDYNNLINKKVFSEIGFDVPM